MISRAAPQQIMMISYAADVADSSIVLGEAACSSRVVLRLSANSSTRRTTANEDNEAKETYGVVALVNCSEGAPSYFATYSIATNDLFHSSSITSAWP
jgi:hypothetical protein